ncbi:MAG: LysM peptidoglycan-binding domain-containing protein, partial [Alphaproteobacteria bacterium]|nr:LysM peptidoglycan-binding domain-containing protein [Alphaproteobacteria bacterium]
MRGIARTGASVAAIGLALLLVACSRKTPAPVEFGSDKAVFAKPSEPGPGDAKGSIPIVSGFYQVETDETLYAISRKTRISLRDLIAVNGLAPPYRLRKGQ